MIPKVSCIILGIPWDSGCIFFSTSKTDLDLVVQILLQVNSLVLVLLCSIMSVYCKAMSIFTPVLTEVGKILYVPTLHSKSSATEQINIRLYSVKKSCIRKPVNFI